MTSGLTAPKTAWAVWRLPELEPGRRRRLGVSVLGVGPQVGVGVQRLVGGGVPEPALHDLHAIPAVDEQRGVDEGSGFRSAARPRPAGAQTRRWNQVRRAAGRGACAVARGGLGRGEMRRSRSAARCRPAHPPHQPRRAPERAWAPQRRMMPRSPGPSRDDERPATQIRCCRQSAAACEQWKRQPRACGQGGARPVSRPRGPSPTSIPNAAAGSRSFGGRGPVVIRFLAGQRGRRRGPVRRRRRAFAAPTTSDG